MDFERIQRRLTCLIPWIGIGLIAAYWWSIHPPDFSMGYVEDLCPDVLRKLIAENQTLFGKLVFHSDSYMAPYGISMPYMSWSIERDWIGAYFWKWNPRLPFLWLYYGLSLLVSYLGTGHFLRKMKLPSGAAWGLATAVVLFHIPRHFKTWHHFEHLPQHWLYLSLFLDAWIWQRFWREKKCSVQLEAWRGVFLLGVFMSTGYFWGAMLLEWLIVRSCILFCMMRRVRNGIKTQFSIRLSSLILPVLIGLGFLLVEVQWFSSLYNEVGHFGKVTSGLGYFAYFYEPFRPLWLGNFLPSQWQFYKVSETVTSIGWIWVIPFFLVVGILRKKVRGPGLGVILPFLLFIIIIDLWQTRIIPFGMIRVIQKIPFLEFFRVATRWSLFMPASIGVVLALAWPELEIWARKTLRSSKRNQLLFFLFALSSAVEMSWLLFPVNSLPAIPADLKAMLKEISLTAGSTVLDLPFCVAGGNGVCSEQQCPNYPFSTVGQCLRLWHDKKVYGLYAARMNESACKIYDQNPYLSWFSAWKEQRCLTGNEWKDFCGYLDQHTELSAVLLYPDIWVGAGRPECLQEFDKHLGGRAHEIVMPRSPSFGGVWTSSSRVILYSPKCIH